MVSIDRHDRLYELSLCLVLQDAKSDYRPDPLDVKFSMGAGAQQMRAVGGASTGPNAGTASAM